MAQLVGPVLTLWRPPDFAAHPMKRPMVPRLAIGRRVIDGDTLDVDIELGLGVHHYTRIRLKGVDAPEVQHPLTPAEAALGAQAKHAVALLCENRPLVVDLGSESQVQGRFIATVQYYDDATKTWHDLAQYLTDHHLLKRDVTL